MNFIKTQKGLVRSDMVIVVRIMEGQSDFVRIEYRTAMPMHDADDWRSCRTVCHISEIHKLGLNVSDLVNDTEYPDGSR